MSVHGGSWSNAWTQTTRSPVPIVKTLSLICEGTLSFNNNTARSSDRSSNIPQTLSLILAASHEKHNSSNHSNQTTFISNSKERYRHKPDAPQLASYSIEHCAFSNVLTLAPRPVWR